MPTRRSAPRDTSPSPEPLVQRPRAAKAAAPAAEAPAPGGPRVLKKYPNRRLYDTQASSYITLADVKQMVMAGEAFEVRDAKTAEDITRSILLQIILEEETGGVPIFSTPMLAQLIRFYGHAMQSVMGVFLERNLQQFVEFQARLPMMGSNPFDPSVYAAGPWAQNPLAQQWMSSYLEQSRTMLAQLQEQWAKSSTLFGVLPGLGPAGGPGSKP